MSERLKNKIAIVVGAGSVAQGWGNGKACAVLYAREGAKVLAVDVNLEAAIETKRIIDGDGGECATFKTDVTDSDNVKEMVNKCIESYGRIDILHNNVGIPEVGGLEQTTEENWDKFLAINTKGMFLTCKSCIPQMVKQGCGAIINISSVASMRYLGYPSISYNASKGAVNQLTQTIAVQYADKGIRANCVLPGFIHTPLVDKFLVSGDKKDAQEIIQRRHDAVPMKRMGDAWDVAYASLFLASDEAKYVTGANLVVDGGLTCKVV